MTPPLITLTTDFGDESPYVAAMKGALLWVNPAARLVDLTHAIPPQDVRYASYFLAAALPYFPPQTLHVVVVDPGVGSERAILYAEVAGQRVLAPDNGCLTALFTECGPPTNLRRVRASRYFRPEVSATFHGRDIFAPVAGHLSLGLDPAKLGPSVGDWVRLETPAPEITKDGICGEVAFVDHFGNLISNIPAEMVRDKPRCVRIGRRVIRQFAWVRTYAEARPGELALLVSSDGKMELAIAQGNAARRLRARPGTPFILNFKSLV
jgi:S-adenosyl-L-methionine hydrolase (adenosine-forming)